MNNIFISYDLNSPGQNYEKLEQAIKTLGSCSKLQKSFWYVSSNLSAVEAEKRVWAVMDPNDSLVVVNVTNDDVVWNNLSPEVGEHIQDRWFR